MRTVLLLLAFSAALLAVPATAEAHIAYCDDGNLRCELQCWRDHFDRNFLNEDHGCFSSGP